MTAYRARLTDMDIRRLVKATDEDERAAAAHKLCRSMDQATLTGDEREAAQKILRLLADDAAELVRRALTVTLKTSDLIPHDVARRLIADVDSVAMPLIACSPVFTDADLIEIVQAGSGARQTAVAGRPWVGRDVASVVADVGCEAAVQALASNDNADISEMSLTRCVERFGGSPDVVAALAHRKVLPLGVAEKLIALASDAVREHLVTRHAIAPETAIRLATATRERATIDLLDQAAEEGDLGAFVAGLNARRALTASLLLRALARGEMTFVEHGLSELAGTPHQRAALMVHDAGPLGLKALYDRAGLPPRLFQAFRAGVDTWRTLAVEGASLDAATFGERMLERFLTQRPNAPRDDVAYLLERLDGGQPEGVRPSSAAAA